MRKAAILLASALAFGLGAGFAVATEAAGGRGSPPLPALLPKPPHAVASGVVRSAPQVVVHERRGSSVSTLAVPRLHLRSRIYAATELDRGPAWWPVTGRPGGGDTVAIAGHRTTHTHPFYFLDQLRRGDRIYLRYDGATHTYRVTDTRVVPSIDLHIADAVGHERLLLSACTPRGSAAFRLVVEARPSSAS
jgi:LPXTG-site transpeptidase (sortase) family protein